MLSLFGATRLGRLFVVELRSESANTHRDFRKFSRLASVEILLFVPNSSPINEKNRFGFDFATCDFHAQLQVRLPFAAGQTTL